METYAGFKKIYGCYLCGSTVRPVKTVRYVKDNTRADLCEKCWNESRDFEPFQEGLKKGEIVVSDFS